MKSVVVTGASTGIGWGCAKVLTGAGFRVFGGVRRAEDGERLAKGFGASFTPLLFDVTDEKAVRAAAGEVERALGGETLFGLVNNAGIAVGGPLLYLKIDDFRRQLDVNLIGQLIVTQAFGPLLGAGRSYKGEPGRIVMISSLGGRNALPFFGPYCAAKFGLEGLSESLRREFMLFGVDVIVVAPGAVATPIWGKAEGLEKPFAATPYATALEIMKRFLRAQAKEGLRPEAIGETVKNALTAPKPRTRYTVALNRLENRIMAVLPKRFVDRQIASRLKLQG
jgi:NAD(P)-dependent dehydrogenase (short-subunit alcohol dehydrogenase family)